MQARGQAPPTSLFLCTSTDPQGVWHLQRTFFKGVGGPPLPSHPSDMASGDTSPLELTAVHPVMRRAERARLLYLLYAGPLHQPLRVVNGLSIAAPGLAHHHPKSCEIDLPGTASGRPFIFAAYRRPPRHSGAQELPWWPDTA